MFFDAAKEIEQVLGIVKRAEGVSFREVEACLRAARPILVMAGATQQDFDAAAAQVIDALLDGTVLAQGGEAVAVQIACVLCGLPGMADALARGAQHSERSLSGHDQWAPKGGIVQSGRHWAVGAPVREGMFAFAPGQQLQRPAKGALRFYVGDHHQPALDPAAIRRMMRSLGRDFGPDSPSGGSLARR